jgi:two-component system CheB/CheR fusion protein
MTDHSPANIEALHEQRDWLLVTLSSIGDAVITTDGEGRVTFLNPVAESLTGWTPHEAVGQPLDGVIRFINEESRRPVEIPTIQALREGRTVKLASHSLLIAKDSTERPVSDSAALISNAKGEVAGVVLVFRDITERRKTERALDKALAYADDIIATLREPFVVLDGDLRVKTANRSFYDTFHVSKEETENRFVYDLGNGQWDIPGLRTLLDEVLSRNQSVHDFEVEHSFPTLGRKIMLLNARPFSPNSNRPELILLAVEDVSALRERSDELAQASRHKDEFLATLAHELRNPLAPIRNAIQYLGMEGLTEPDVKTAMDIIDRQVTVMVRLIDDLLDVSRISHNKLDIRKRRVELATVVESAVESSRPLIEQCGHELTVSLPAQPIYLDADPIRLAQVFLNLLNNAAKYTKRGGHIWITAEREGSDAVVSVRDNGIGVPGDMLARIFDMFTQVDRSSEQSQGGLGIGLTLVRQLVEMHDGSIEARSNGPDEGSEFVVRLPLLIQPPHEPPPKSDGLKAKALSECRILVVDDNKDSADSLAKLLRLKGNEIRIAHDGLEAVEVAETFHPELVLLDIGLPKLNGYEVARRIRQQPWGRDVILVALTGWGQDEDRRRSQEAGFNFHIVKPLELAVLEKLLAGLQASTETGVCIIRPVARPNRRRNIAADP